MDFGDILDRWEADTSKDENVARPSAHRKTVAGKENTTAIVQAAWLERHGVPENAALARDTHSEPRLTRQDIDAMPVDACLDLHGMTKTEADVALGSFFRIAERDGSRKVLIVHGKGLHSASEPVLASYVRTWLERRASAGRTGHADAANGGKGATWVLLKRSGDQRSR